MRKQAVSKDSRLRSSDSRLYQEGKIILSTGCKEIRVCHRER